MLDKGSNDKDRYLIVGGTTKAATSSFYHYLSQHPKVAVTRKKECGYWLDADYAHFSKNRYVEGRSNEYRSLFMNKPDASLHVDVSPDYLYSAGTLQRLLRQVPNSQFLFLLREPISRIVSWFNFSRQLGILPPNETLNDYIEKMLDSGHQPQSTDQHLQALQQGRYGMFLKPYISELATERFRIVYYEELINNEQATMLDICKWLRIDADYFQSYKFEQRNKSTDYKSRSFHQTYHRFKSKLRLRTMQVPWVHWVFQRLSIVVDPVLLKFNSKPTHKADVIRPELMQKLIKYYRNDMALINEISTVPQSYKNLYDLA